MKDGVAQSRPSSCKILAPNQKNLPLFPNFARRMPTYVAQSCFARLWEAETAYPVAAATSIAHLSPQNRLPDQTCILKLIIKFGISAQIKPQLHLLKIYTTYSHWFTVDFAVNSRAWGSTKVRNGMMETYTTWYHHGERLDQASSSYVTRVETVECNVDPNEQVMNILNDVYPYASSNTNQEGGEGGDDGRPTMDSEAFKNYEKLLKMPSKNYIRENKALDKCPVCNEPRFKMTSQNRNTKIPQKVMRYLPLKPRLQRLYMSMQTATDMRWHKEGQVNDDVIRHPADGEAWKEFDRMYPYFAADPRNVKLGLATDGFNPFGVLNLMHNTWPVVVFPYNLPPWKCMKKEYMMLTLLINEDPGKSIDVYLRPLVDELKDLWENGVRTYDKYTGQMFTMRAAVMWTINDFSAYAMVSGWLPWDNEWRQNDKAFDDTKEIRPRPREWSGDEILDQLNRLEFGHFGKGVSNPRLTTHLNWTHKSMLFELPYWSKLKLRHNLDLMHIEKNVFDTLVGTILDIERKTKDTIEARLDLERMGIRSSLWMKNVGGTLKKGHPFFTVKPNGKKEFFQLYFFCKVSRWLTARCLRKSNVKQLQDDIVNVLCKFEQIFPPSFFTSMIHVMIHLPDEALLAGPVNCRWMYLIERYLGELKKCVRNKAKPEGSFVEAWVVYESLTFCAMYLEDVETAFNRPQRNNDGGVRKEKLSFLGATRDDKLSTQNSGVHVLGAGDSEDIDFYGKLTSVLQLLYKDRCQVILFKCLWFDTNPLNRTSVKRDHGLLSVNTMRHWYDEDPYILTTMAKQIFYLDDPKAGNGWKVVQKIDRRGLYDISEQDHDDNYDNVADQQLSSSIEIGEETLRDTNIVQEAFDVVGFPEFEISIDLGDLPQYNAPEEANEDEDKWESGNDSSEDSESYYCSLDDD
ncbi:unnamed protein product [Malus baccata var. baccata]